MSSLKHLQMLKAKSKEKKSNHVTSLLDSFLDDSSMHKIRDENFLTEQLKKHTIAKNTIRAEDTMVKVQSENKSSIWSNP